MFELIERKLNLFDYEYQMLGIGLTIGVVLAIIILKIQSPNSKVVMTERVNDMNTELNMLLSTNKSYLKILERSVPDE